MKRRKLAAKRYERRKTKVKSAIRRLRKIKLLVNRSTTHIYAQIIDVSGKVLAAASTLEKEVREGLKHTGNCDAAAAVGALVAKRAVKAGVKEVAFDRAGNLYHGRVKALANAARENGLEF
jgi:large subunit ribosomal protein L18